MVTQESAPNQWPRSATVYLVVLALAISLPLAYDYWVLSEFVPPSSSVTIYEFADTMPPPQSLRVSKWQGANVVVWIGATPRTLVPASGPPCYVFEESGKLVDWTMDTGDDHHMAELMDSTSQKDAITLENLLNSSR